MKSLKKNISFTILQKRVLQNNSNRNIIRILPTKLYQLLPPKVIDFFFIRFYFFLSKMPIIHISLFKWVAICLKKNCNSIE